MSYTAINVPYCALINTMTTRHSEVISCQAWRFVLCGVAGFGLRRAAVAGKSAGPGNTAQGYQYGVGVLCAIAVVMFLCCFFWVRERVSLDVMGKFTLREHIAGLRRNDQLLLMLVMSFLLINVLISVAVATCTSSPTSLAVQLAIPPCFHYGDLCLYFRRRHHQPVIPPF